jgi:hypothetical protein
MIVPDYTIKDGVRYTRYWGFNIDKVEALRNAKFVCEVAVKINETWTDAPSAIFWQETPPNPDYSHYFALFSKENLVSEDRAIYISSGEGAVGQPLDGIVAANGDIVYSAYRHDFRYSPDKSVWIDGGRDYVRYSPPATLVKLKFEKDQLVLVNNDS